MPNDMILEMIYPHFNFALRKCILSPESHDITLSICYQLPYLYNIKRRKCVLGESTLS